MNNGDLQLLPSHKRHINFSALSGNNRFISIAIVVFLLSCGAYGVLAYLKNKAVAEVSAIDLQIEEIYKNRNKQEEEKLQNFQKQLTTTKSLLRSHLMWSVGFQTMEKMIQPRVQFLSLTADASRQLYSFHAVADTYTTVARQIAAFYQSDTISDIRLNKVGVSGDGKVDFTMDITFNATKFLTQRQK